MFKVFQSFPVRSLSLLFVYCYFKYHPPSLSLSINNFLRFICAITVQRLQQRFHMLKARQEGGRESKFIEGKWMLGFFLSHLITVIK